jgi:hypothetical protein
VKGPLAGYCPVCHHLVRTNGEPMRERPADLVTDLTLTLFTCNDCRPRYCEGCGRERQRSERTCTCRGHSDLAQPDPRPRPRCDYCGKELTEDEGATQLIALSPATTATLMVCEACRSPQQ